MDWQVVGVIRGGSWRHFSGDISVECMFTAWQLPVGCMAVGFLVHVFSLPRGVLYVTGEKGVFREETVFLGQKAGYDA